jgi:hypothetical protein
VASVGTDVADARPPCRTAPRANHSYDFGPEGLEQTIAALHNAGVAQDGLPGEITVVKAGGERITASLLDIPAAQALIRKATNEAKIVVVAIRAGAEGPEAQRVTGQEETYLGEDRGNPEEFARMAVRARRRPSARIGATRPAGDGDLPPPPDRLQPRQRLRLPQFRHRRGRGRLCGFARHLDRAGEFRSSRIASVGLVEAWQPVPDPSGEGTQLIELSSEDLGSSGLRIGADGRILSP